MERFLVATDLSPRSDRAVSRAWSLARELKARLSILHVLEEEYPPGIADRMRMEAEKAIDAQVASLPALPKEAFSRSIVSGSAFRGILEEAKKGAADLVVMGTHRRDFLGDFFVGTTVERVLRHGDRPVLVVRDRVTGPYRRVLVGMDFSVYSRRAIEFAINFVPNGDFSLVHAFDVPYGGFLSGSSVDEEFARTRKAQMEAMLEEEMAAFLKALPSPPASLQPVLRRGAVGEVLREQIATLKPDLLVVGTHGRTGVAGAVLGSVATGLLSEPPCDVLAVKAW